MSLSMRGRQSPIGSPPRKQTKRSEAMGSPSAQDDQALVVSEAQSSGGNPPAPGGRAQVPGQALVSASAKAPESWPPVPATPPTTLSLLGADGVDPALLALQARVETLQRELQASRERQALVEGGSKFMLAAALQAQHAQFSTQLEQAVERQTFTAAQAQELQQTLLATAQAAEAKAQEAEHKRVSQELQGVMAMEHVSVQYRQEHERILAAQNASWEERFRQLEARTSQERAQELGERTRLQEQAHAASLLAQNQCAAMAQKAEDREAQIQAQNLLAQSKFDQVVMEYNREKQQGLTIMAQVQDLQQANQVLMVEMQQMRTEMAQGLHASTPPDPPFAPHRVPGKAAAPPIVSIDVTRVPGRAASPDPICVAPVASMDVATRVPGRAASPSPPVDVVSMDVPSRVPGRAASLSVSHPTDTPAKDSVKALVKYHQAEIAAVAKQPIIVDISQGDPPTPDRPTDWYVIRDGLDESPDSVPKTLSQATTGIPPLTSPITVGMNSPIDGVPKESLVEVTRVPGKAASLPTSQLDDSSTVLSKAVAPVSQSPPLKSTSVPCPSPMQAAIAGVTKSADSQGPIPKQSNTEPSPPNPEPPATACPEGPQSSEEGKEADAITIEQGPGYNSLDMWKFNVCRAVGTGSKNPDEAFKWMRSVEQATTMQDLADPGKFSTLDAKLATALRPHVKRDLRRLVDIEEQNLAREDKMLKGRQLYWMIINDMKRTDDEERIRLREKFFALEYRGSLRDYQSEWHRRLMDVHPKPSEEDLFIKYQRDIKKCVELQADYTFNRRQHAFKGTRQTLADLMDLVEFHLSEQKAARNRGEHPIGSAMPSAQSSGRQVPNGHCPKYWRTGKCDRPKGQCSSIHRLGPEAREKRSKEDGRDKYKGRKEERGRSGRSGSREGGRRNQRQSRGRDKSNERNRRNSPAPSSRKSTSRDTSRSSYRSSRQSSQTSRTTQSSRPSSAKPRTGMLGIAPNGQKDRPVCRFHVAGKCKHGDKCKDWHPGNCRNWEANGTCKYGSSCIFGHMSAAPAAKSKSKKKKKKNKDKDKKKQGAAAAAVESEEKPLNP